MNNGLIRKFLILLVAIYVPILSSSLAQQNNKSLLWKISGNELKKPSYLFGTIHLICPSDFIWTRAMDSAFDKCDRICFEMDLSDASITVEAAKAMIDNSGKHLEDYFTDEQYKNLTKYVKDKLGMDMTLFRQLKPFALQTMLSEQFSVCNDPISYEDSLMKMAQKHHQGIIGLESIQEQIDVIGLLPNDSVIKDINDIVNGKSYADTAYTKMVDAYKHQDLPDLYDQVAGSGGLGTESGSFLDDRNKKWISRIQEKISSSSVFFAVGAGHLWGNNGVIALLRQEGYSVSPVK